MKKERGVIGPDHNDSRNRLIISHEQVWLSAPTPPTASGCQSGPRSLLSHSLQCVCEINESLKTEQSEQR